MHKARLSSNRSCEHVKENKLKDLNSLRSYYKEQERRLVQK